MEVARETMYAGVCLPCEVAGYAQTHHHLIFWICHLARFRTMCLCLSKKLLKPVSVLWFFSILSAEIKYLSFENNNGCCYHARAAFIAKLRTICIFFFYGEKNWWLFLTVKMFSLLWTGKSLIFQRPSAGGSLLLLLIWLVNVSLW